MSNENQQAADAAVETLRETPPNLAEGSVDGQRAKWDRRGARDELNFFERRHARKTGRLPVVATIDLSNAF